MYAVRDVQDNSIKPSDEPKSNKKKQLNDMKKETRFEELNYWRDISRLKESMRKVLKEYWLLQKKKEFLGTYLSKLNKIEW